MVASSRGGLHNGSEGQSDRPAPAGQPHLGQPLVRRVARTMATCCWKICAMREFIHEDAASRPAISQGRSSSVRHKKCRVTIHAARPGVIIGKKGADIEKLRKKLAAMTKSANVHAQHRRSPQAGNRRQAGGAGHRPADGAPRFLPPRDEARACRTRMRLGALASGSTCAWPSWRRRNRPDRMVPRRPRAAAHAARRHRLCRSRGARPPMASSASRSGSSRAKSLSMIRMAHDRR